MPDELTLKRVIDLEEKSEITNGDYALVDSISGGAKKFALGVKLNGLPAMIDDQIDAKLNDLPAMIDDQIDTKFGDSIGDEVTSWLDENVDPVGSAVVVDGTLSIVGAAADAKKTGDEISDLKDGLTAVESDVTDLKEDISQLSGLSEEVKVALLQIAQKVAYIDEHGQDYYDDLYDALYPPADLVSISAVYTQSGTVYDTDSLDSLKSDLVVTAHMSDQTTRTVTEYTLSGTLAEGTSTITVTYGGKTTTFTVTVTEAPPYTFYDYLQGDGTAFLDTGLSAKTYLADSYKKYVKFRLGTIANEKCVFGVRNGWGTTGVIVQINTATSDRLNVCFGNAWTKDSTPVANDLIELELDHPTIKKNGETLGTVSSASAAITSATATIPLFCTWGGSSGGESISYNGGYLSQFFPYKIYRFTVTEKSTGTVIADMKPAMRVSDGAVGMYDSVRDEFYTNARNTGVFTLGNDGA